MKLVLASKSPRRKEILSMTGVEFDIRVSDADESYDSSISLFDVPSSLAKRKAEAVEIGDDEIIIGSDTVVIYDGKLLGKPKDDNEAIEMLKMLSGTEHYVVSGIAIRARNKIVADSVTTIVKMRNLDIKEIISYVESDHPTDKAGAYGIQDKAGAFVEKIDGDFYNVVGLPLCRLCEILKKEFNISILE